MATSTPIFLEICTEPVGKGVGFAGQAAKKSGGGKLSPISKIGVFGPKLGGGDTFTEGILSHRDSKTKVFKTWAHPIGWVNHKFLKQNSFKMKKTC